MLFESNVNVNVGMDISLIIEAQVHALQWLIPLSELTKSKEKTNNSVALNQGKAPVPRLK